MGIEYENGHFKFDEDFMRLAKMVADMEEERFQAAKFQVEYIINNKIKDKQEIERTLDLLFDFLEDDEALLLYRKLCRHYWFIDKQATSEYIQFYIDEYDPEHKKFGNPNKNIQNNQNDQNNLNNNTNKDDDLEK